MVDTKLLDKPKLPGAEFHLGMIGDVPQSKRLDRALDIFEELYATDNRYQLFIKGKRPEDYTWMHSNARKSDMDYYADQYQRIKDGGWEENVFFEGHGPIDEWLQNVGWILSVSDHESFHLSVAEGMASGAQPLVLNWAGSDSVYSSCAIFSDEKEIVSRVLKVGVDEALNREYSVRFESNNGSQQIINLF